MFLLWSSEKQPLAAIWHHKATRKKHTDSYEKQKKIKIMRLVMELYGNFTDYIDYLANPNCSPRTDSSKAPFSKANFPFTKVCVTIEENVCPSKGDHLHL